ncbi:MAG: hypothetical protein ACOYNN_13685 [Terrimicrobiaceae bacterium]
MSDQPPIETSLGSAISASPLPLLRIRTESYPSPSRLISQMLFQPICTPYPGHGVIINFPTATLSDVNANLIASGFVSVRLRPEVISEISLLLIGQLLQPFKGAFDLNVNGSYTIYPPSNMIEVVADDIAATNICPS